MHPLNKLFRLLGLFAALCIPIPFARAETPCNLPEVLDADVFNAAAYSARNPDLPLNGITSAQALQSHWINEGVSEGRSASWVFSVQEYIAAYPDLQAAFGSNYCAAVQHFVSGGGRDGGRSGSYLLLPQIFDWRFYLGSNPDLMGLGTKAAAAQHWITHGIFESRRASPLFKASDYLAINKINMATLQPAPYWNWLTLIFQQANPAWFSGPWAPSNAYSNTYFQNLAAIYNYSQKVLALRHAETGPQGASSPAVGTIKMPAQRVGALFSVWQSLTTRAILQGMQAPYSVEDLLRGNGAFTLGDMNWNTAAENPTHYRYNGSTKTAVAGDPYWPYWEWSGRLDYQLTPYSGLTPNASGYGMGDPGAIGFYCFYAPRPGEATGNWGSITPTYAPPTGNWDYTCPNVSDVVRRHAEQLWSSGIDYIVIDSTNWDAISHHGDSTDIQVLRPIEVLFEQWNALRNQGIMTPEIAIFAQAWTGGSTDPNLALYQNYIKLYAEYPNIAMHAYNSANGNYAPVIFLADGSALGTVSTPTTPGARQLADLKAAGITPVSMWTGFAPSIYAKGEWAFMSECTNSAGGITTSIVGAGDCNQNMTSNSPIRSVPAGTPGTHGTSLNVARAYNASYGSRPFQGTGSFDGLTLMKQFKTALDAHPDFILLGWWNQLLAGAWSQPTAATKTAAATGNYGFGGTPMGISANMLGSTYMAGVTNSPTWVDDFGGDFSSDMEPSVTYEPSHPGDLYYKLMRSCLDVYQGSGNCEAAGTDTAPCCQISQKEALYANVFSYRKSIKIGSKTLTDHYLTQSSSESKWTPVSVNGYMAFSSIFPFSATPKNSIAAEQAGQVENDGPFIAFASQQPNTIPLYRCLTSAGNHFYSIYGNATTGACEAGRIDRATDSGVVAYISTNKKGSTPRELHRCYSSVLQEHYLSLDVSCNPNGWSIVSPVGGRAWVDEGVLGYVR